MEIYRNMRGPYPEVKLLNEMGEALTDYKYKLIRNANVLYEPKVLLFVGNDQWVALHGIGHRDTQSPKGNGSTGELQWLGATIVRTFKQDYFVMCEKR